MKIIIQENGNLKLQIEVEDVEFIHDMGYDDTISTDDDVLCELLQPYSCNGSYAYFDAGNGNPFIGFTDAPCIAEELDYLDSGTIAIIGRFWYYGDYMSKSFINELTENGEVIFTLGS